MNIKDKTIVIAGGGSGLGLAAAEYLIKKKSARVALFDLDENKGKAAAEKLGRENALFCKTNIVEESLVNQAVLQTMQHYGSIHGVINAAATPLSFKILDREGRASNLEKFKNVIAVNLIGTFNVMSQCVEQMAKNTLEEGERGIVINTSSISSFEGQIGTSAYSASKAGVNGMNMPVARELGPIGIRVNSIAPGLFDTPMVSQLDDEAKEGLLSICEAPKRMGKPEEFAHACGFLIENAYMNGRVIRLDGAAVMCMPS